MRTTNDNIRQLLEMLDNPDAYTEQEIQDIINRDEDTRGTYRLMVEAKRTSRHRQDSKSGDVNAAWQRFAKKQNFQSSIFNLQFGKIAATFIGILLVTGIAFAAIHMMHQSQKTETPKTEVTESTTSPVTTTQADIFASDTVVVEPVIYDNIPLEKMLPEIASYYDKEVEFQNDDIRQLRFYFVWKQDETLDAVLHRLNLFESVTVQLKSDKIIVE